MKKVTAEEFKKVFRFYRGEKNCPYNEKTDEQRRLWCIWMLEKCLASATTDIVLERYYDYMDESPAEITEADVSEAEKICAFYIYVASDTFMSANALEEYFSCPIVYEEDSEGARFVRGCMRIVVGDITKVECDAIVNAANAYHIGGGGIDGAIHRAAGPELALACSKFERNGSGEWCPTGEARTTGAFNIATAKWVIHTAGPDCNRMSVEDARPLLASCYRSCLEEALRVGAKSIAFPAISTGIFGFPKEEAPAIALSETGAVLAEHPDLEVIFCCFGEADRRCYAEYL